MRRMKYAPALFGKRPSRFTLSALLLSVVACSSSTNDPPPTQPVVDTPEALLTSFSANVNPFIGTQNEGNTFPGATLPFGMVQMSPDTGHYAGYNYDQAVIKGFSLMHLSGVGCPLGGFFPILPTTGPVTATNFAVYQEAYTHESETAKPGYYAVTVTAAAGPIRAELGATTHTGVQRYTFPATTEANVLINPGQGLGAVNGSTIEIVDDKTVDATTTMSGFCQPTKPFTVHSRTRFNRPFTSYGTWVADDITANSKTATGFRTGAYLRFDTTTDTAVEAVTSISYVDAAGANANLDAEYTTLAAASEAAATVWEGWLSKIALSASSASDQVRLRAFYSALYRAFLTPNTGTDVDGRYQGWDGQAHKAEGFTYYQNFSLWDTYRTQQQFLALLAPKEASDMALSVVLQAEQGGWLPRWSYGPVETNVMTGDPVTPFLVSAWSEGLLKGNEERAYAVLKKNADTLPPGDIPQNGRGGNDYYVARGYVPYDFSAHGKAGDFDLNQGGSATLEYALSDGVLSTMAAALGNAADATRYAARAQNYRSIYDTSTMAFHARALDGFFIADSDPSKAPGFHEATAIQYQWLVQQDMPGLIEILGGPAAAAAKLDGFFAYDELMKDRANTVRNLWVNGAYDYYLTTYNPNNEPDLHSPYVYLWTGQPWKTADVVRGALSLFTDGPSGVTGNDDLGTMSAWAILSSLGLYPAIPGQDLWAISTPVFSRALVTLDPAFYPQGKLDIRAAGVSDAQRYIQSVSLGDQAIANGYISGADLHKGSVLTFKTGATPSTWATGVDAAPKSLAAGPIPSRLTAAAAITSTTIAAGAKVDVQVKVLAQGAAMINGTITVEGSDKVTLTSGGTWQAEAKGLATQITVPVQLVLGADLAPGTYALNIVVRDASANEVKSAVSLIVP